MIICLEEEQCTVEYEQYETVAKGKTWYKNYVHQNSAQHSIQLGQIILDFVS